MAPAESVYRGVHYIIVLGGEAEELVPEVTQGLKGRAAHVNEEGLRSDVNHLGMEVDEGDLSLRAMEEWYHFHESLALATIPTGDGMDLRQREPRVLLPLLFHPGMKALHALSLDDDVASLPLADELPD